MIARFGLVLVCVLPRTIAAQSGDALSIVGAVTMVEVRGRDVGGASGGIGYDIQVRFAASGSRSSVGAGIYGSTHPFSAVEDRGRFVELRVALRADTTHVTPYVTARLSHLRQGFGAFRGPGAALGVGAGALLAVAPRLRLDGSATLAHVWLPAFDSNWIAGHGMSLTLRVGAAVRVG